MDRARSHPWKDIRWQVARLITRPLDTAKEVGAGDRASRLRNRSRQRERQRARLRRHPRFTTALPNFLPLWTPLVRPWIDQAVHVGRVLGEN